MNDLFLILAFVSIVGIIIGIAKPSFLRMKSRKQAFLIFGGSTVLFFILFGVTAKPTENPASISSIETSQSTSANTPQTLEEKITKAVNDSLGDKNNMGKPRIIEVSVDPYNSAELKQYSYPADKKILTVLVKINASENLTSNLQQGTMHDEASQVFEQVFPLSTDIVDVLVWSHISVKDQYGNTKDDLAIVYSMSRSLSDKMNWSNFNHRELPTLLTSEKKSDDRNSYYEAIKF